MIALWGRTLMLAVGLAMDAFSVSLANGLRQPDMRPGRMCAIAGTFGAFQALMPLAGWLCVHLLVRTVRAAQEAVPALALGVLGFIGARMIREGVRGGEESPPALGTGTLLLQGLATSVDALSAGFTLAEQALRPALASLGVIALVTFVLCLAGLFLGRRFGTVLAGGATVLGGGILIVIGAEIFIKWLMRG